MRKAILFPGQGSQYKGMGKALFSKYAKTTTLASDILGYDLEELCVKDPKKQLKQTQFTQPALYVVNHFKYQDQPENPNYFIGHSLGEYNALLAAGAFDFETGLRLVQKRGELMAAASGGGMAAVLGLKIEDLKEKLIMGNYNDIDVANFNTPTQIVLSGKKERIDEIVKDFTAQKIKIIPLNVSAPFHSRYMKPAVEKFERFLGGFNFKPLHTPVIANVTARPYIDKEIKKMLGQQIESSVQWTDSIRYLMGQEIEEYQEIGRGILTRMTTDIRKNCQPILEKNNNMNLVVKNTNTNSKTSKPTNGVPTHNGRDSTKINGLATKLGSAHFRKAYGVDYNYIAGAMYRGTASKELIIRMGKAGMLSFLGTGGMSLAQMAGDIDAIQKELGKEGPYGMNLLHHIGNPELEMKTVQLFLEKGVQNIEASAFMQMTEAIVYFHVSGLEQGQGNEIIQKNKIMAKCSRPEVAEAFLRPAPEKILNRLLENDRISETQAELAKRIPVSYDICVEADSGGHTDMGIGMVLLPSIQRLAKDIQEEYQYPQPIRVGLAGGIGTPQSAASAFIMGADFILTGSINQCTVEAGTSDAVKHLLEDINVQDTAYAPAGDMFEIGAKVQVLRKGTLFAARANKLHNLYMQYNSLDAIPAKTVAQLEKNYFKKPLSQIWSETKVYFTKKGQTAEIEKAEKNSKHKMSLVFRWYFGYSSRVAFNGEMEDKVNFQIHTGPALGAFNQWVKGTELESWRNRHVDEIGIKIMEGTANLLSTYLEGKL